MRLSPWAENTNKVNKSIHFTSTLKPIKISCSYFNLYLKMRIKFVRLCYLALYCVAHYVCRLAWYVIVLSYSVISGNSFTQYNLHTLIRSLETTKATQISEEKLRYKTAWIYFLNLLIFFRVEKRLD